LQAAQKNKERAMLDTLLFRALLCLQAAQKNKEQALLDTLLFRALLCLQAAQKNKESKADALAKKVEGKQTQISRARLQVHLPHMIPRVIFVQDQAAAVQVLLF
jgi:hypothetical protein